MHCSSYIVLKATQANRLREGNIEILYSLGIVYEKMGWYRDAIETFMSVVEIDADILPLYHHIGILYAREGKIEEAIGWFDKGLAQIDSLYRRGIVSLKKMLHERRRKAMTIFEHVFPRDQMDTCSDIAFFQALFHNDMGVCYVERKDEKKAEALFLKALWKESGIEESVS